ncbi:MAG: class I SAM-dependent methyltransferase [Nitrospinaceae bacterium]
MTQESRNTLPLGDFQPADQWQIHVNSIFYGTLGPAIHNHFQTYASLDHRLAHSLAEEYFEQVRDQPLSPGPRYILELGVGNGNLARCFLSRLREIDSGGRVYPRTHYVLCDYSEEILKGVRSNPRLREHAGHFSTIRADASGLGCFRPQSVDKIISNEIWDDLATRVLLKHQGTLYEEYLQPHLDPALIGGDFETFSGCFGGKNYSALREYPPFLSHIHWEKSYQRVDIGDWPYPANLQAQIERFADEIPMPVNIGAFTTLERARGLLRPGGQGYRGFDYGMFSIDDLNREGRPYFNLYGGQYTFMVNFDLLVRVGKAVGFENVEKEYQHHYVAGNSARKVTSLVEILQSHPQIPQMAPWDRDLLMVQTLHALNRAYRSPYKNKMEYPLLPGTPKKQRKQIAQLVKKLSPYGVPDTVAYVTDGEVFSVIGTLKRLGYSERGLHQVFDGPPDAITFVTLNFR